MVNAIPARNLPVLNFDYHLPNLRTYRFVHVNGKTNHGKEAGSNSPNTSSFSLPLTHPPSFVACHGSVIKRNHVTETVAPFLTLHFKGGARFIG